LIRKYPLIKIFFLLVLILTFFSCEEEAKKIEKVETSIPEVKDTVIQNPDYEIIIASFLGDEKRCYYGEGPPSSLDLIWKCWLGGAVSHMPHNESGLNNRYGAGWTGQPLLFREKGELYLLQGSYDYHLRKIDAATGEVIWKYAFDDAIKGTGTLWLNKNTDRDEAKLIILQGSRQNAKSMYNFKCISVTSGEELFRMKVEKTPSCSRDVDGSALIINDTAYIGFENGLFEVFNPNDDYTSRYKNFYEPEIYNELKLYSSKDLARVGCNIITESSSSLLDRKIYIAAGSGYVYGYNIDKGEIDWEFFIGSDLNGSCVVTEDSCLLVPVEKQFIAGKGGILKLNPRKGHEEAVEWYFPVNNLHLLDWDGGVIGSTCINDKYKTSGQKFLTAFSGIDGYLYVIDYKSIDGTTKSFDGKTIVNKPELVFKYKIGSSISTPIIFDNKLIAAGYEGIYLFEFDENNEFTLLDKKNYVFEATPIAFDGKIYLASKDGYLYCFGE
jgi:outer membrane protein assembly factor BamB